MATSRLQIYNDALLLCGERFLNSLTEEREPRRLLDHVWNNEGVEGCLEEGQWFFAMRTIRIDYDPGIEPEYGYQYAFEKPSDWRLTSAVCQDEFFRVPQTRYFDESDYWYSDLTELYIRYVSDDSGYGLDLSRWPRKFTKFVAAHFASEIIHKIDAERANEMLAVRERRLMESKNHDAMADSTVFPAQGSWSSARQQGYSRRDRGNRGNLIG